MSNDPGLIEFDAKAFSASELDRDTEQAFLNTQSLPLAQRGESFEALFFRQLHKVVTRIHDTENLQQLMLEASGDICRLFHADRLTLYVVTPERNAIVSTIKVGLNTSTEIKLPINAQSVAGYVALTGQVLNVSDVYDDKALKRIHPELRFLKEVDKRSGYRTRQMLVAPVLDGEAVTGVLQVINQKNDEAFSELALEGAIQLCKTLATAMRQRREGAGSSGGATRRQSKYDALVSDGVMSAQELTQCIQQARQQGLALEHVLTSQYHITPAQIGHSLAQFFSVPYEPHNMRYGFDPSIHSHLSREFLAEQGWAPLAYVPEGLLVACLDPGAVRRVVPQVFPKISGFVYRVTTSADLEQTLDALFGLPSGPASAIDSLLADLRDTDTSDEASPDTVMESEASDNELVKFVNQLITDAYNKRASDIHIEPMPGRVKTGVRLRIDGSLEPYIEVPAQFRQALITRLKIMCDLDISEKRKPQDGKIKFKRYAPLDIELRVATLPSVGGMEDVVMRILAGGEPIALDDLGLTPHNRERLEKTVSLPYGLFYVCGPTGSGKTTTLHSVLKFLNRPDTKIWTAEDPVEITQAGLRQVQINKKAGVDFATVMRAFLRADPDIIMVGESRDHETVAMGVEASLTGHLVFSTLHTNSAPESITRLLDMGMDPFNFADALLGILAQRLAKRLCACKQAYQPDDDELNALVREYALDLSQTPAWQQNPQAQAEQLLQQWRSTYGNKGHLTLHRAQGCERCNHSGYKGRLGLHELLVADDAIKRLVQERARVADIFTSAVANGMRTLKMDGIEKVLMGLTDIKQVRSVCIK